MTKQKLRSFEFRAFVIRKFKYIKDLEAILLRLGEQKGNKVGGKFAKRHDLKHRLKPLIQKEHRMLNHMFLVL